MILQTRKKARSQLSPTPGKLQSGQACINTSLVDKQSDRMFISIACLCYVVSIAIIVQ